MTIYSIFKPGIYIKYLFEAMFTLQIYTIYTLSLQNPNFFDPCWEITLLVIG